MGQTLKAGAGGVLEKADDFICAFTIGINEEGQFFKLVNNSDREVSVTVGPAEAAMIESMWRKMCADLGIEYKAPDWSGDIFNTGWTP